MSDNQTSPSKAWRPATRQLHAGLERTEYGETSEALFLIVAALVYSFSVSGSLQVLALSAIALAAVGIEAGFRHVDAVDRLISQSCASRSCEGKQP